MYAGCTASLRPEQNIGDEESGGRACTEKLLSGESPITVGFLTTDADGKASKGFSSVMQEATKSPTENMLDQVPSSCSLRRALTNVWLAGDMLPANTVANKQKQQERFAEDLSYCVQAELNACRQFHKHDTKNRWQNVWTLSSTAIGAAIPSVKRKRLYIEGGQSMASPSCPVG